MTVYEYAFFGTAPARFEDDGPDLLDYYKGDDAGESSSFSDLEDETGSTYTTDSTTDSDLDTADSMISSGFVEDESMVLVCLRWLIDRFNLQIGSAHTADSNSSGFVADDSIVLVCLRWLVDGFCSWLNRRPRFEDDSGTVPTSLSSIRALQEVAPTAVLGTDDACGVCLDDFPVPRRPGVVVRMPCAHLYHRDCIVTWLKKSHLCPLCRFAMPTSRN